MGGVKRRIATRRGGGGDYAKKKGGTKERKAGRQAGRRKCHGRGPPWLSLTSLLGASEA